MYAPDPGRKQFESQVARIVKAIGGGSDPLDDSIDDVRQMLQLYLDSMASHSITNDKRLFVGGEPSRITPITVRDWEDKISVIDLGGDTVFGPMMYSASSSCTILAGYEIEKLFMLDWKSDKFEVDITGIMDDSFKLNFRIDDNRVLSCSNMSEDIMNQIVNREVRMCRAYGTEEEATIASVMTRDGHSRAMESIYCHKCMGHIGKEQLIRTVDMNILKHVPFNSTDVKNMECIMMNDCIHCQMAKSQLSKIQTNYKSGLVEKGSLLPYRHTIPDVEKQFAVDLYSLVEILGCDLMYIDGFIYLVAVGRNKGYTHVIALTSKKKGVILKALQLIISDYKRYNVEVTGIADCKVKYKQQPEDSPVVKIRGIESDNEPSMVSIAASDIIGMNVEMKFKVAGEHVSYVERKIRTIKERVTATRVGLNWKVSGKVLTWLISSIVMWINVMFSTRAPRSAWLNLGNSPLSYRDLTRTSFGDVLIAHSPRKPHQDGEPKGELGISLGANPRQPGAIFFMSLTTQMVKTRYRFKLTGDIDLTKSFGSNKFYFQQKSISKSYMEYVKNNRIDAIPPVIDVRNELNVQGGNESSLKDDSTSCFMHDMGSTLTSAVPGISDISQAEKVVELEAVAMKVICDGDETIVQHAIEADDISATIMAAKIGKPRSINWRKALKNSTGPRNSAGLSETAARAIDKELRQICIEYDVASPIDYRVDNYHRSHDLYDTEKDKARLVIGKTISEVLIDYGVEINSPTMNSKLLSTMLSMCVEEDLEFEVWDVKGAFLKAKCPNSNVHVRIEAHIAQMMIALLKSEDNELWKSYESKLRKDGSLMMNVRKGWYGLTAASALWNKEINETLVGLGGYTRSSIDSCLYYKDTEHGRAYIMLHVDDMGVMIRKGSPERDRILKILEDKYEKMKIQTGDDIKYIGLEVH